MNIFLQSIIIYDLLQLGVKKCHFTQSKLILRKSFLFTFYFLKLRFLIPNNVQKIFIFPTLWWLIVVPPPPSPSSTPLALIYFWFFFHQGNSYSNPPSPLLPWVLSNLKFPTKTKELRHVYQQIEIFFANFTQNNFVFFFSILLRSRHTFYHHKGSIQVHSSFFFFLISFFLFLIYVTPCSQISIFFRVSRTYAHSNTVFEQ